jgi:hypothetical protein
MFLFGESRVHENVYPTTVPRHSQTLITTQFLSIQINHRHLLAAPHQHNTTNSRDVTLDHPAKRRQHWGDANTAGKHHDSGVGEVSQHLCVAAAIELIHTDARRPGAIKVRRQSLDFPCPVAHDLDVNRHGGTASGGNTHGMPFMPRNSGNLDLDPLSRFHGVALLKGNHQADKARYGPSEANDLYWTARGK